MASETRQSNKGSIRIISGKWRGRKLPVLPQPGLRPTPDRVRETLFNWLRPVIAGAVCLDLYAGTGALGFEALSRGAGRVVMIEKDRLLVQELRRQAQLLGTDAAEVFHADAISWLAAAEQQFDLVFLDPPFGKNLAAASCELLLNRGHLHQLSLVYVESEPGIISGIIDDNTYQIYRQSRAGQVAYTLLKYAQDNLE